MTAPRVVTNHTTLIMSPAATMGMVSGNVTPEKVKALKQHVVAMSLHMAKIKAQILMSQYALAGLDQKVVEAAVVAGYPPPAV